MFPLVCFNSLSTPQICYLVTILMTWVKTPSMMQGQKTFDLCILIYDLHERCWFDFLIDEYKIEKLNVWMKVPSYTFEYNFVGFALSCNVRLVLFLKLSPFPFLALCGNCCILFIWFYLGGSNFIDVNNIKVLL